MRALYISDPKELQLVSLNMLCTTKISIYVNNLPFLCFTILGKCLLCSNFRRQLFLYEALCVSRFGYNIHSVIYNLFRILFYSYSQFLPFLYYVIILYFSFTRGHYI